jgi:hypothetical protein
MKYMSQTAFIVFMVVALIISIAYAVAERRKKK